VQIGYDIKNIAVGIDEIDIHKAQKGVSYQNELRGRK
jgi:hypothetical protein